MKYDLTLLTKFRRTFLFAIVELPLIHHPGGSKVYLYTSSTCICTLTHKIKICMNNFEIACKGFPCATANAYGASANGSPIKVKLQFLYTSYLVCAAS